MDILSKTLGELDINDSNDNNDNNDSNENTANNILIKYDLIELLSLKPIDNKLTNVSFVEVKGESDLLTIPKAAGGVYFITTNERVLHTFHNHTIPSPLQNGFEVVYNGVAKDLRERARKHLLRTVNKGMSGMSIDVLTSGEKVESHTKCCFSANLKAKTPYVNGKRIKTIEDVNLMNLSNTEKTFVLQHKDGKRSFYMKNGIDVADAKHSSYTYRFYFCPIKSHNVRDIVETSWRKMYGLPRLCTYSEGR